MNKTETYHIVDDSVLLRTFEDFVSLRYAYALIIRKLTLSIFHTNKCDLTLTYSDGEGMLCLFTTE